MSAVAEFFNQVSAEHSEMFHELKEFGRSSLSFR